MQFNPDNAPAVFTPEAISAINQAYAKACRTLQALDEQHDLRHRLAVHIIQLAREGELDEDRLSVQAVAAERARGAAPPHGGIDLPPAAVPGARGVGEFQRKA